MYPPHERHDFLKVYRHPYQETFPLGFAISLGEDEEEDIAEPITIVEVNRRTSFEIRGVYMYNY